MRASDCAVRLANAIERISGRSDCGAVRLEAICVRKIGHDDRVAAIR